MSQSGVFLLLMALAAQQQHHVKAETEARVEQTCLTEALYYEARSEGVRGQLAVAEVVLQRKRSGFHPNTICGVVYEPMQFSFVSDGSTLRELDIEAWNRADKLAERILHQEVKTSVTGRAMFYHTKDVRPVWADAMVKTIEIGNHIFYRPAPRHRSS